MFVFIKLLKIWNNNLKENTIIGYKWDISQKCAKEAWFNHGPFSMV